MKNICLLLVLTAMLWNTVPSQAQSSLPKNSITYKVLAYDHLAPINQSYFEGGQMTLGAEIGYFRNINKSFQVGLPLRLASIDFPLDETGERIDRGVFGAGADAVGQYRFNNDYLLKETAWFAPFLFAGIGGQYLDGLADPFDAQVPVGLGINFRLGQHVYVQAQTEYRFSLVQGRDHLAHSAGLVFFFNEKNYVERPPERKCPDVPGMPGVSSCLDEDQDGVLNVDDACPTVAGMAKFSGCPDSDGDGITDKEDQCPQKAGPGKTNGCPDSDGDGIIDVEDQCPNAAGPAALGGCPDTDGDGILDREDQCPTVAGLPEYQGCPAPDTDKDGVPDNKDACPTVAGLAKYGGCPDTDSDGMADNIDKCPKVFGTLANQGCPELKAEDKQTLIDAMLAVQFETGLAELLPESFLVLDKVADVLRRNPAYVCRIEGHTDDVGEVVKNQKLSEDRAKTCHDYLTVKGIDPARLSYAGLGETRPIGDNATKEGRLLNRRTEFILSIK